jgi:Holliday junction DNA helicase RuvA
MIGQLRGKLIEKQPPFLLVDVQGVGYWVQTPLSTFFKLPGLNEEIILRTHCVVREDAQLLFGFSNPDECRLFQEIIKISGVGPKIALAILSGLNPAEFAEIVLSQAPERLKGLPGIGTKTAQRIVVEMQDRLAKLHPDSANMTDVVLKRPQSGSVQEAIAALVSLGYKPSEAAKAVNKVANKAQDCEHIIKEALQGLAKI